MRTYVYVDGFNLYYRMFRNSRRRKAVPNHCKWLNLELLMKKLLPHDDIRYIGYFTARVVRDRRDPDQADRQDAYLDALATIPCLEIVEGQFRRRGKSFEEKGSDVNLASRLIRDAFLDRYGRAVVISNDSDLVGAMDIVINDCGKLVYVNSPDLFVLTEISNTVTKAHIVHPRTLVGCEFPDTIRSADGRIILRPRRWRRMRQ